MRNVRDLPMLSTVFFVLLKCLFYMHFFAILPEHPNETNSGYIQDRGEKILHLNCA